MTRQNDFLDRMRIAAPCNVGWENMSGDERARFCNQCRLHVYNISEMTRPQVASLIASTEGRICARLYRRTDGTVLTRDCPVGLRALRKRISRRAGAVLTAILSLGSGLIGQTKPQEDKTCARIVALKIKRTIVKDGLGVFTGVVMDEMGAVIVGAKITLINQDSKEKLTATSADDGAFKVSDLAAGKYTFEIEAVGFKKPKLTELVVHAKEVVRVDVTLQFKGETITVGVLVEDRQIETTNGTTTIRGEMLRNLPIN
jgi:hypothetical protein